MIFIRCWWGKQRTFLPMDFEKKKYTKIKSNKLKVIDNDFERKRTHFHFCFHGSNATPTKKNLHDIRSLCKYIICYLFHLAQFQTVRKQSSLSMAVCVCVYFLSSLRNSSLNILYYAEELEEMPTKSNTLNWRCTTQFKGEKQSTNLIITHIHNVHFLHCYSMNVSGDIFSLAFSNC